MLVSVLNPKIALFFLAFLPQFVDPHGASVPQQIVVLGLVYVSLALVTDGGYALLASRLRGWLGTRGLHGPLPRYLCGSVYLGLGISTALPVAGRSVRVNTDGRPVRVPDHREVAGGG